MVLKAIHKLKYWNKAKEECTTPLLVFELKDKSIVRLPLDIARCYIFYPFVMLEYSVVGYTFERVISAHFTIDTPYTRSTFNSGHYGSLRNQMDALSRLGEYAWCTPLAKTFNVLVTRCKYTRGGHNRIHWLEINVLTKNFWRCVLTKSDWHMMGRLPGPKSVVRYREFHLVPLLRDLLKSKEIERRELGEKESDVGLIE